MRMLDEQKHERGRGGEGLSHAQGKEITAMQTNAACMRYQFYW